MNSEYIKYKGDDINPTIRKSYPIEKNLKPNECQEKALSLFIKWFLKKDTPTFFVTGGPGTGKTAFSNISIKYLIDNKLLIGKEIIAMAFTSTAAGKLRDYLGEFGIFPKTIHSTLFTVANGTKGSKLEYYPKNREEFFIKYNTVKLLIVDEISMVSKEFMDVILELKIPTLLLGDIKQIPPVNDDVTEYANHPDFILTTSERTNKNSKVAVLAKIIDSICMEKPIKDWKTYIESRKNKVRKFGGKKPIHPVRYIQNTIKEYLTKLYPDVFMVSFLKGFLPNILNYVKDGIMILCGMNIVRHYLIQTIRQNLEICYPKKDDRNSFKSKLLGYNCLLPQVGEPLICIKNMDFVNDRGIQVDSMSNGDEYILRKVRYVNMKEDLAVIDLERKRDGAMFTQIKTRLSYFFVDNDSGFIDDIDITRFTFGYARTYHKSQGSEENKAVVILDWSGIDTLKNMIYTAVTRAKSKVVLVETEDEMFKVKDDSGEYVTNPKYAINYPPELEKHIKEIKNRIKTSKNNKGDTDDCGVIIVKEIYGEMEDMNQFFM